MTSLFDKGSFVAIFIVLLLMPVVSHAGGLGVAPLIFILGALGLILAIKTKRFEITRVQFALIIFLAWLCITALWSPYRPDDFLTNYLKLFLMGIIYYWSWPLFEYVGRRRPIPLQNLLVATWFLGAGVLVIDLLTGFGITYLFNPETDHRRSIDAEMNLGHAITVLVLLAAPVTALLLARLQRGIAYPAIVLFLGLIIWAAWLNNLSVGILGVVGVVAAVTAGHFFPRKIPNLLLCLTIITIMAAPLLAYFSFYYAPNAPIDFPMSWDHRLRMWSYCWQVIADHPIGGAGFDASRTFNETYIARDGRELTTVSLHPHNAGIQIWTETGLIGAVLASTLIATLFKPVKAFAQSRSQAGAVSGIIMATLIISSLTYGAWQFWWWGCVFFAIGTLYLLPPSKQPTPLDDA